MEHSTCGWVELASARERYDDMDLPRKANQLEVFLRREVRLRTTTPCAYTKLRKHFIYREDGRFRLRFILAARWSGERRKESCSIVVGGWC